MIAIAVDGVAGMPAGSPTESLTASAAQFIVSMVALGILGGLGWVRRPDAKG